MDGTVQPPVDAEQVERFVEALRCGAPNAALRLPVRGMLPVEDVMLDNCLFVHAASRQLRRFAVPVGVADQLRRYDESAAILWQDFHTPGPAMLIPPAARAAIGASALRALAFAMTLPSPLWLCQHLWGNRLDEALFIFQTGAALACDLAQHAEDMLALYHERQLEPARVRRVLDTLASLPDQSPLSAARAAGPLPLQMTFVFVIIHDGKILCSPGVKRPVAVADGDTYFPELAAVTERLFLAPRDAPLPLAVLSAAGGAPMRCMSPCRAPCGVCGGERGTRLYFRASPTWRAARRQLAGGGAERGAGSRIAAAGARARQCNCRECDACGAPLARAHRKCCSRCRAVWLCGDACMRRFWPRHKAECRAAPAVQ